MRILQSAISKYLKCVLNTWVSDSSQLGFPELLQLSHLNKLLVLVYIGLPSGNKSSGRMGKGKLHVPLFVYVNTGHCFVQVNGLDFVSGFAQKWKDFWISICIYAKLIPINERCNVKNQSGYHEKWGGGLPYAQVPTGTQLNLDCCYFPIPSYWSLVSLLENM